MSALTVILKNASRRGLTLRPAFTRGFEQYMPDPMEHATGLEKKEKLAIKAGNEDPFNQNIIKRGVGTKDTPNLVPSAFDSRIIGCICNEDCCHVTWMWLHKGQPRRCGCGYWFKLIEKPSIV